MDEVTWDSLLNDLRTKEEWDTYMTHVREFRDTEEYIKYMKLIHQELRKALMKQASMELKKFFNNPDVRTKRLMEQAYKLPLKAVPPDELDNLKKVLADKGYTTVLADKCLVIH